MKTVVMMAVAVMLGNVTWAAAKDEEQKVVACIDDGSEQAGVVAMAAKIAYTVFRQAGVKLEWHTGQRFCQAQRDEVITVSLSKNTPKELSPGAAAQARPYEGVHIQVFFDRIAAAPPDLLPHLLAYVVVHEITHALQGIARHSDSGIMKAQWNGPDYRLMMTNQLLFTNRDIVLIHEGLATRAARRNSDALLADAPL